MVPVSRCPSPPVTIIATQLLNKKADAESALCGTPMRRESQGQTISFEARITNEIMGHRKNHSPTTFGFTKSWCHLSASSLDFIGVRYVGAADIEE